jgi:hypothetical protein
MSDSVPFNDTNELPSFLLNPDVNNTANVEELANIEETANVKELANIEETANVEELANVEETSSNVEETSLNVEETSLNVEETSLNVEETSLNVEETSLNVEETSLNVEETLLNVEETSLNVGETSLNVEETSLNVGETLLNVGETSLNVGETLSSAPAPAPAPIFESPPNPIVELMKNHSKIALLIGLNYSTLKNRIRYVNNAKQILIDSYNYTEENIMVLTEPSRKDLTKTLNLVMGSSSLVTQIIIYYSGYGNGIKPDLSKEPGIIDNLAKVMVPADFTQIDVAELLAQSCCKTLCIMDMCPYQDEDMQLKWSVDIQNHVKIVTFCESDSHNSNKNKLLQQMINELVIS